MIGERATVIGLLHSTPRSIALLLAGCALLVWAIVPVVTGSGAPEAQAQVEFVCDLSFDVDAPGQINAEPGDQFSYGFVASISVYEVISINLSVSPGSAPGLIVSASPAQTSIQVQDPPARTTYEVPGTISIGVPFDASGGSYLVSGVNASAICQAVGGGTGNTSAPGPTIQVNVIEPTPTPTATDTPTPTATATDIPTATNTSTPTATDTPSPTPTATNTATSTATTPPSPTPTSTSTSTSTATSPPNATNTPTATATGTASPTSPNASTPTPTATAPQPATSTATGTSTSTPTATQSPASTGTPTATGTVTSTPTGTVSVTPSASGTPTNLAGTSTASATGTRPAASATSTDEGPTEEADDVGAPESTSTPEGEVESAASSLVLDFTEERAVVLVEDDNGRSWLQIGAGLLGLALIAGGGYGIWRGRERGL